MAQDFTRRGLIAGAAAMGVAIPLSGQAAPGPAKPRQGFARGRFGEIHYLTAEPARPTGKLPLLTLHASPGSARYNESFIALMGADRRVVAPDTPGYGISDRPPTPPTIEDFAAAMGDLVDALGLKRVDLLGSHTGSATAVELMRQRPGLVRKLVLNSALMYTDKDRADFRANYNTRKVADLDAAVAQFPERWAQFKASRADLSADEAWLLFWENNRNPAHASWGYDASFAYDFAKTFVTLKEPVLVLNPRDVLFEMTARARDLRSNIRVVDLPWAGGVFGTHGPETARIIRDFLDS